jgi:hypothetical protein
VIARVIRLTDAARTVAFTRGNEKDAIVLRMEEGGWSRIVWELRSSYMNCGLDPVSLPRLHDGVGSDWCYDVAKRKDHVEGASMMLRPVLLSDFAQPGSGLQVKVDRLVQLPVY